jgi:hypothetical protein
MSGPPQITTDPTIYQLAVLKYVTSQQCLHPSVAKFLLSIEGVAFACGFSCICAHDAEKEMMGYIFIPEKLRQTFRDALSIKTGADGQQTIDQIKYVDMLPLAIDLIAKQVCSYHTVCAKLTEEMVADATIISEMKTQLNAESVFRGPRMPDGKVRMIFLISGGMAVDELIAAIKTTK